MAGQVAAPAPLQEVAALADEAHRLLGDDPRGAQARAREAVRLARALRAHEIESVALRARGIAALDLGGAPEAVEHLRAAVAAARRAGCGQRVAEARMSLAHALQHDGRSSAALRQAGLAMAQDEARDDGRLAQQHALILTRLGRLDAAIDGFRHALVLARRSGDTRAEVLALLNRGIANTYRGELRAAESDYRACQALADRIGQGLFAAFALGNLGHVATVRGDLPEALACFDAAEPVLAQASDTRVALMELDRCRAHLAGGLRSEALTSATRVVELLARCEMATELAEARLALAEAALESGETATALAEAERAAAEFSAQRRPAWTALADSVAVRAAFARGVRDAALHARARRNADALVAAGWPTAALDARVLAARVALALGWDRKAARELAAVAGARRGGPVAQRVGAWHAEALLRLATGRRASALRALRAGLAVLDAHRLTLGATELRTGVAVHGNALTALGLGLALASGRAAPVLEWAERGRAGALWQRPARPPDDAELAADLGELRGLLAAIGEAGKDAADTTRLMRRQAELEASVRSRARHAAGPDADGGGHGAPPSAALLRDALGARVLIEFVLDGGELWAVVVEAGASRLQRLTASVDDVGRELAALRFTLRKLGRGGGSAASLAVARDNAEHAATRLDGLLLAPLTERADDRELVLVPTGDLHAVPWAALPTCAGRALSVAPSAALWLRAAERRAPQRTSLLLVAGPGLPEAEAEVRALAARHREATALVGEAASVPAVAAELETATSAHIASHGIFRADNPLFSSLQLADGPLTVYDLERLTSAPRVMILSACDGGVTAVRPGDELMGFSGALLALGTSALIASVVPVADEPTRRLMLALHERLALGEEPAAALAAASAAALDGRAGADYATAAGFVCFGAGSPAAPSSS